MVAATVKRDELPSEMDFGFATIVTVGVGGCMTVTATEAVAVPSGPVAVTV